MIYEITPHTDQLQAMLKGFSNTLEQVSTATNYCKAVTRFIEWTQTQGYESITTQTLYDYRTHLLDTCKPSTVNTNLSAIRKFYDYMESVYGIQNVSRGVKNVKIDTDTVKSWLEPNEIKKVLKCVSRYTLIDARDRAIFVLMIFTGLRTIEVTRAVMEDLREENGQLRLYIQGKGTHDKKHYVVITRPVQEELQNYFRYRGKCAPNSPLFATRAGKPLKTINVRKIIEKIYRLTGLKRKGLSAHSTRHTAATLALLGGADLQSVKAMMRHKSINTTLIYAHNLDRWNNPAERKIEALLADD